MNQILNTQMEAIDRVFDIASRSNEPWNRLLTALWEAVEFDPDECASCDKCVKTSDAYATGDSPPAFSCEGNIFSCVRMFEDACEVGRTAKEIHDTPNVLRRQAE